MTSVNVNSQNYVTQLQVTDKSEQNNLTVSINEYEKYCKNSSANPIETIDGIFKAGMRREAVQNTRKFDKIDSDKDGILSEKEICDNRDKVYLNNYFGHLAAKISGGILMVGGAVITGVCPPVGVAIVSAGVAVYGIDGIVDACDNCEGAYEKTREYEQKLNTEA